MVLDDPRPIGSRSQCSVLGVPAPHKWRIPHLWFCVGYIRNYHCQLTCHENTKMIILEQEVWIMLAAISSAMTLEYLKAVLGR